MGGNDPYAALYWLATMVAAGEDPRFIARRIIIAASEDVGNADPRALQVAVAAAQALDWVGLPEAQYALAHADAVAPHAGMRRGQQVGRHGLGAVLADIGQGGPVGLADAVRLRGHRDVHGRLGYRYPHDYEDADVDQQYLPDLLRERRYYEPSDQGMERQIGDRLEARRVARQDGSRRSHKER